MRYAVAALLEAKHGVDASNAPKSLRAAVDLVVARWSGGTFAALCDRTMWNMHYDASEALAAFLFVLCAYASNSGT